MGGTTTGRNADQAHGGCTMSSPLPAPFVARLRMLIPPAHWDHVWRSFHEPRLSCFRVNTLKTCPEQVHAELQRMGIAWHTWPDKMDALFVAPEDRSRVLDSALYAAGLLYSQSLASQLCARMLAAQPGERVLDMCAAPGGKTLQLACMMQATGELLANEAVRKRFFKLKGVLAAQGVEHFVRTSLADGRVLWRRHGASFDRVLVDAPCSTEARFHADRPASFRYWSPRKIKEMRHKQKGLLRSGLRCVKPGGTLIYATCSFAPEENELVVFDALKHFAGEVTLAPIALAGVKCMPGLAQWQERAFPEELRRCCRILPDEWTEGLFIACFKKRS
ncbi:MAG: RsmB/NOP family class I SAM-dependent RNA methyltransferase [Zetaproteobacteria bacterium]|nr:MAG: RsmB/NOP family class I SAM-dependent RNA methyltransferase [Zetaproteobacteria bacterium]